MHDRSKSDGKSRRRRQFEGLRAPAWPFRVQQHTAAASPSVRRRSHLADKAIVVQKYACSARRTNVHGAASLN